MKDIKSAIKQSKFKSITEKVFVNILYTSNWLRDLQTPIFKEFGLQAQHFNVLKIVKGKHPKPSSPGEILDVMLDKGRDLTRLVDKLVKLEMLERRTCPTNRRKVDIFITEKGIEQTQKIEEKIERLFKNIQSLSNEEAEQLSFLLDKLRS